MKLAKRAHRLTLLLAYSVWSVTLIAQPPGKSDSRWKTFANRAGWTIKHPANWRIGSCTNCSDPADPWVYVTLYNATSDELIMIEHLADKPADRSVEQWLNDVKASTNLNPRVREEWITFSGLRALRVINGSPDSTESENLYFVHDSQTFAIRTQHDGSSRPLVQRILSSFRFTADKPQP
jgi:hypothetical protein